MTDILIRRFEQFFRHPNADHDILHFGDRALACLNIRAAVGMLDGPVSRRAAPDDDGENYDESLVDAVREFQLKYHHRVADGQVGPGTRARLVSELLHRYDVSIFRRLRRPVAWDKPSVFISYAWADTQKVDRIDQWLRDHGVHVVRDRDAFVAGETIEENIAQALSRSDKILAVFSHHSSTRDWPRLERTLAEQVEDRLGSRVLIYLRLDETPLPAYDSTRIAVTAGENTLKTIGEQLLHAIAGAPLQAPQHPYDENTPL